MSDEMVAFLNARLNEDEAAAKDRRGVWPSPGVEDSGAVWLHIKRGGNAVTVHYTQPDEGYGDMADLRNWADAESGWTADRVLREVAADRKLIAAYKHADETAEYPDFDGGYASGLEYALKLRVAQFSDHPDYREEWKP